MCISIIRRVGIIKVSSRRRNTLRDNDGYNESIDSQHARHDNGNNVFNDTRGMVDSHVTYTQTGPPSTPGGTPTGENHAGTGAHVAAAKGGERREQVIETYLLCYCYSRTLFTYKKGAQSGQVSLPATTSVMALS
jgi:hypothetical protein